MIKTIRLFFFFIFKKLIPPEWLHTYLKNERLLFNSQNCVLGKNSFFLEGSIVTNVQQSKQQIQIGDNCLIEGELFINAYGGKIEVGNNTFIGKHSKIWSGSEIKIGNHVQISHNVNIIDTNTHSLNATTRRKEYLEVLNNGSITDDKEISKAPIIIEDDVWISFNATILKGVTIGKGAVVAANAVVTKNVEPYTVVAGNPAVLIKKIEN
ncbi:MAG: acyltransferase [Chitinophagales bacterium]